jgi:MFS family permease
MVLWGTGQGVFNGPMQALFADSIPRGDRAKWYTYLTMCNQIMSVAGPLFTIALFSYYGNKWSFDEMRPIMTIGIAAEAIPAFINFFFKDIANSKKCANEQNSSETNSPDLRGKPLDNSLEAKKKLLQSPVISDSNSLNSKRGETQPAAAAEEEEMGDIMGRQCCMGFVRARRVPYFIFAGNMFFAVGSGMTVKFFPLFFGNSLEDGGLNLSPSQVQLIYTAVPLSMAVGMLVAQRTAKAIGRIQTCTLFGAIGITCLVGMAVSVEKYTQWVQAHRWVVVAIYVFRTCVMNCTFAIQESVMMVRAPHMPFVHRLFARLAFNFRLVAANCVACRIL